MRVVGLSSPETLIIGIGTLLRPAEPFTDDEWIADAVAMRRTFTGFKVRVLARIKSVPVASKVASSTVRCLITFNTTASLRRTRQTKIRTGTTKTIKLFYVSCLELMLTTLLGRAETTI